LMILQDMVNMTNTVDATDAVDITDIVDVTNAVDMIDALELFVSKTFQNWDYVAKFMKKYATSKGYRVRIGSGSKDAHRKSTFSKFYHKSTSSEEDIGLLLRRLHDKKIKDLQ
ncbi:13662_t:CDS:2, partial [Funneliformis mosseae]